MAGKLRERANIKGGTIDGCALVDPATFLVDETVARAPSHYRTQASGQDRTLNRTDRVSRTLVSAPGASTAGDLRTKAPVSTAQPVVQHYFAEDGEWRRVSTGESSWGAWRPTDRPVAPSGWAPITLATTNAQTKDVAAISSIYPEDVGSGVVVDTVADVLATLINALIDNGTLAS